ncbi:MAG: flagellar protein export ATPase FliI [Armatimonadetes bacterium]|nr:flagellar protein export ATPase FliI [Armatimonadota bacterium]
MAPQPVFDRIDSALAKTPRFNELGRVRQVVGLVVQSNGPPARLGEVCLIKPGPDSDKVRAEVVGFKGDNVMLMPLGEMTGVRAGSLVEATGECLRVPVGDALLGRVLNGLGDPIDDLGPLDTEATYPNIAPPPGALERQMIEHPFETGVRAIDSLLTIGVGQRIGIFSGSGVGKSTLLGMVARNGSADVNVIALVGERGREVQEFIKNDLGEEGMRRSVVVCATSDEPALVRIKAALTATAIAESFRDEGKNVMLMMDSVTRFATAQREVGLSIGEPPSTKGYTPSVFALLPKLMERAGCGPKGAITAIYTILVDGDDTNEPIADATRAILDGHIVLSRKLTNRGHYPPIDVLQSVSRVMPTVTTQEHIERANRFREMVAAYYDVEDLVSVGAYKPGSQPKSDMAIERWDAINAFLRQGRDEATPLADSVQQLEKLTDA